MDIACRSILTLAVDDLPVVACFIEKNPRNSHLFPETDAPLDFWLAEALTVAQTDIAENLCSGTSLCQGSDNASCFLIFLCTNSWGIAVRALIGKFDSITKHHHV